MLSSTHHTASGKATGGKCIFTPRPRKQEGCTPRGTRERPGSRTPPAGLRMGWIHVLLPEGEVGGRGGHLEPECGAAPGQGGGEDTETERRWPDHRGVSQGQSPGKDACFGGRWAARSWKDGETARTVGVAPGSRGVRRRSLRPGRGWRPPGTSPGAPRLPRKVRPAPLRRPRTMRDAGLTIEGFPLRAVPFPAALPQLPPRSPPPRRRAPAPAELPSVTAAFEATPSSYDLRGNRDLLGVFFQIVRRARININIFTHGWTLQFSIQK